MNEEKVITIIEKYARAAKGEDAIPLQSEDADVIFAYCLSVKEVGLGCPDCTLKKRYGKGERCPIVVTLGG